LTNLPADNVLSCLIVWYEFGKNYSFVTRQENCLCDTFSACQDVSDAQ